MLVAFQKMSPYRHRERPVARNSYYQTPDPWPTRVCINPDWPSGQHDLGFRLEGRFEP